MVPELLKQQLENWKEKCLQDETLRMPKIMYINPTGKFSLQTNTRTLHCFQ